MSHMAMVKRSTMRTASQLWRLMHQPAGSAIIPSRSRQVTTSESIANQKLDGKVAIITGAAGELGRATARLFAAHGAQVVVADIADEKGHNVCSEIGSNAHYKHCDVTKEEDVASTVDFAMEKFGKLDIMFNNVGCVTDSLDTFEGLNLDDYDRYTTVNVRGVLVGIKHASRVMIPAMQGVILNTASTVGILTSGSFPIVYNINKHNLPGLTRIAAYHLGKHGIRVNAISPHAVFTPTSMVADWLSQFSAGKVNFEQAKQVFTRHSSLLGKQCTEVDIAKGALFLCSDDSGYVSGQNLVVDGGWCNSKEYDVIADILNLMSSE